MTKAELKAAVERLTEDAALADSWSPNIAKWGTHRYLRDVGIDIRTVLAELNRRSSPIGSGDVGARHEVVARSIADGFTNGNELYDEATAGQRDRYDRAADAVLAALFSPDHVSPVPYSEGNIEAVRREAYKQGWSDREADIIERGERIAPSPEGGEIAAFRRITSEDQETLGLLYAPPERLSDKPDTVGEYRIAKPRHYTWATHIVPLPDLLAALTAPPSANEGWKLVPVEPTPEMVAAWCRIKNTGSLVPGETGEDRSDYAAYRAMLSASPSRKDGQAEEIERLREALRPFANEAETWPEAILDKDDRAFLGQGEEGGYEADFRFSDLRRARAALNGEKG
ncbi:MAG: hypothetical protein KA105_02520 [Caulobacter sp.]|nr:hypothetical protein [Caulobacter sp.]